MQWITQKPWLFALALLGATFAIYLPAINGDYIWDDNDHVSGVKVYERPDALYRIWFKPGATVQYYPLSFTAFYVERQIFGVEPWTKGPSPWRATIGYHSVNILLHVGVALLLWRVLRRLGVPGAELAAFIFAIHPVCVMSVAWITELKNTLSGVLYMGALLAYLRFEGIGPALPLSLPRERVAALPKHRGRVRGAFSDTTTSGADPSPGSSARPKNRPLPKKGAGEDSAPDVPARRWGFYALALGLFLLAMFAKTASSLLVVALVLVLWWRGRRGLSWQTVLPVAPFVAIVLMFSRMTFSIEKLHGAQGEFFRLPMMERMLVSATSFWFYLGKLILPYPLVFIYTKWRSDDPRQWLAVLALLGLVVGLWLARKRIGKGPLAAVVYFYVGAASLILAQVLYMMQYTWVADHWQYLASMSLISLAAAGASWWWRQAGPKARKWGAALAALVLLALGEQTAIQCTHYANAGTLWESVLAWNKTSSMVHNNYGALLNLEKDAALAAGQTEWSRELEAAALAHFQEAAALDGHNDAALRNLAGYYLAHREYDHAVFWLEKARAINAGLKEALNDEGLALLERGQAAESVPFFSKALWIDAVDQRTAADLAPPPNDPALVPQVILEAHFVPAHLNLARALLAQPGRTPADRTTAERHLQRALELEPDLAQTHLTLGDTLADDNRLDEAQREYERVLASPQSVPAQIAKAQYGLGRLSFTRRDFAAADRWFEQAVTAQPDWIDARLNLGMTLCARNQIAAALAQFQECVRLKPEHAVAQYQLGSMLQLSGRPGEALDHLQKAVGLKPNYTDAMLSLANLLATSKDAALRQPQRAVVLAEQVCQLTGRKQALPLETLGAAYAASGRFEDAIVTTKAGIERAIAAGDADLAAEMREKVKLYQAGKAE